MASASTDLRSPSAYTALVYTTSCLRTWWKTANLCLSLDTATTAFVGHRHVPSAANQHTFWRSLIRCCWTSSMVQSVNPAARVRHYTRTISTSTQNASILSLTAAAPSDSVFRALCTTYLLTYFPVSERHRPLTSTNLYCLVTEAHRCK